MTTHSTERPPLGTVDPNMPAKVNSNNAATKGPRQPSIHLTIKKGNPGAPAQSRIASRNKNASHAQAETSKIPKAKVDGRLSRENRRKTAAASSVTSTAVPPRHYSKAKPNFPTASAHPAERPAESRRNTVVSVAFTPHSMTRPGISKHNPLSAAPDQEAFGKIFKILEDLGRMKSQNSQPTDNEEQSKLTDVVHNLTTELSKSRAVNEALVGENSSLREQLSSPPDPEDDVSGKYAELSSQVTKLNSDLHSVTTERDTLRVEKESLETSSAAQTKTCTELKAMITTLESDIDTLKVRERELIRQLDKSESALTSREMELRRLERERDAAKLERDDMSMDLQSKTKSLRLAVEDARKFRAANEEMVAEMERLRKDFHTRTGCIQSEAKSRVEVLEKELTSMTDAKECLARNGEAMRLQICSLKDAVSELESKTGRMDAELLTKDARIEARAAECSNLSIELNDTKALLNEKEAEVVSMREQAREDAKQRRKLHNMIQELKGNIRVFCRVRPPVRHEVEALGDHLLFEYTDKGQGVVAHPLPQEQEINRAQPLPFKFDKVFDPSCSQETVFEEISELVQSALDGYRVCIFAYGQTGSGKTYTMLGQRSRSDDVHLGMIPRAVRQVFDSAKSMEVDGWSFKLTASFLEIYNETVRDLLVDNKKASGKEEYRITFNNETSMCVVSDLTVVDVQDENHVQQLIEKSMKNRATAATKANDRSSRSHSVFRLMIEGRNSATGQTLNGLLNLIDLAGSERLNQSKAEGDRLRETKHINKSLSALGDVIAALANRDKHVPFRNSKLTFLLQDSLGGDCKTLMFANVSHAAESLNESVCSLRFAAKVNSCHVGTARRSARIEL